MYLIENYQTPKRISNQYDEICKFFQLSADSGYNEHFHWGRFAWMIAHPNLDVEMLTKIALFRDSDDTLVGIAIFDTCYQDRWYIVHSVSDGKLLRQMIGYITDIDDTPIIKANLNDIALCRSLDDMKYKRQYSESVLTMNLSHDLSYRLQIGFYINDPNGQIDEKQRRSVIHRGFGNDGMPQVPSSEIAETEKQLLVKDYIKTFVIKNEDCVAHCGVWYNVGKTAYIEPVVTVPEYRRKGLGKAVVYEALNRAKKQGAKRAIVLSEQNFYKSIGMEKSSEVGTFVK